MHTHAQDVLHTGTQDSRVTDNGFQALMPMGYRGVNLVILHVQLSHRREAVSLLRLGPAWAINTLIFQSREGHSLLNLVILPFTLQRYFLCLPRPYIDGVG